MQETRRHFFIHLEVRILEFEFWCQWLHWALLKAQVVHSNLHGAKAEGSR